MTSPEHRSLRSLLRRLLAALSASTPGLLAGAALGLLLAACGGSPPASSSATEGDGGAFSLTGAAVGAAPGFAAPRPLFADLPSDSGGAVPGSEEGAADEAERQALLQEVELDDERRRSLVTPASGWTWRGTVPEGAIFVLGAGLLPPTLPTEPAPSPPSPAAALSAAPATSPTPGPDAAAEAGSGGDAVALPTFRIVAQLEAAGEQRLRREVLDLAERADGGWVDLRADLSDYAGDEVLLRVTPWIDGRPAEETSEHRIAWSRTGLVRPRPAEGGDERPNVLFILIDTLRADHTTPYGYHRDTTPNVQALLAGRGVTVEAAYSQAPWTVPSVVSYFTSRYPGEVLTGPIETYRVPPELPTLAEELQGLGYSTGAFIGNFILRDSSGFGRGFDTRYIPPPEPESNFLHADTINRRAIPWLRAQGDRPFFAYVHYMDPHDPYLSPENIDHRSPYYPDYPGRLSGIFVHGVYNGREPLDDPETDVAQLTALYDSEIHYVDRAVGELISALPPEVLENTLVVLTSDHGEELYDHGGWKHGQTLYQEQIHVPLLFRWDRGGLAPGTRLRAADGEVELLDLLPTLLDAAGARPTHESVQGRSLLPALRGEQVLARRPAFAQQLASGPMRAAAVFRQHKLMLFNDSEPFTEQGYLVDYLWRLDLSRLERRELYDLAEDPGEQANLAASEPGMAAALEPIVHHRLGEALPGLRLLVSGLPEGSVLGGRIELGAFPEGRHPYFLSPSDRIEVRGDALVFELKGESPAEGMGEKGLWIEGVEAPETSAESSGEPASLRIELTLDGEPLPAGALRIGEGRIGQGAGESGWVFDLADLVTRSRPERPDGLVVRLWIRSSAGRFEAGDGGVDPEVKRSLQTLGYLQ